MKPLKLFFIITAFIALTGCSEKQISSRKKITIAWWGDLYNKNFITKLTQIYNKSQNKYQIVPVDTPNKKSEYVGYLLRMSTANSLPDIILAQDFQFANFSQKKTVAAIESIDPEFIKLHKNTIVENSWNAGSLHGVQYGIPIWNNVCAMFYNTDAVRDAGLSLPEQQLTWKEFLQIAKKTTVPGVQFGFDGFLRSFRGWGINMLLEQFGTPPFNSDFTQLTLDSKNAREALEYSRDIRLRYKVAPDYNADSSITDLPDESFQTGKIIFKITGRWAYDTLMKNDSFHVSVIKTPYEKRKFMSSSPVFLCISEKSKYKKESLEFIDFLLQEEGQKYIYKMRTDIPVNKNVLASDAFLNSREFPKNDAMFRDELLISDVFRGSYLEGYDEWDNKIMNILLEMYWKGELHTEEFIEKAMKSYGEEVVKNL